MCLIAAKLVGKNRSHSVPLAEHGGVCVCVCVCVSTQNETLDRRLEAVTFYRAAFQQNKWVRPRPRPCARRVEPTASQALESVFGMVRLNTDISPLVRRIEQEGGERARAVAWWGAPACST